MKTIKILSSSKLFPYFLFKYYIKLSKNAFYSVFEKIKVFLIFSFDGKVFTKKFTSKLIITGFKTEIQIRFFSAIKNYFKKLKKTVGPLNKSKIPILSIINGIFIVNFHFKVKYKFKRIHHKFTILFIN